MNSEDNILKSSPVTTAIVLINVAVFVIMSLLGDPSSSRFMISHGGNYWPAILEDHEYYRLLTCAFMHSSVMHIFNNMLVLAYIGSYLERVLGRIKYVIFYLALCLGSSAVSAAWNYHLGEYAVSVGASGAIFGVVGAMLYIVLRNRGRLADLSAQRLCLFIAFSVYQGIASGGIDNAGHIGGLVLGFVLGALLYRRDRHRAGWSGSRRYGV